MLKSGNEERNEFSLGVLKWSGSLFETTKIDMKNVEIIYSNYQKTFGHFELHQEFAHNFWKGYSQKIKNKNGGKGREKKIKFY